jgi:hypothetical protein
MIASHIPRLGASWASTVSAFIQARGYVRRPAPQ